MKVDLVTSRGLFTLGKPFLVYGHNYPYRRIYFRPEVLKHVLEKPNCLWSTSFNEAWSTVAIVYDSGSSLGTLTKLVDRFSWTDTSDPIKHAVDRVLRRLPGEYVALIYGSQVSGPLYMSALATCFTPNLPGKWQLLGVILSTG